MKTNHKTDEKHAKLMNILIWYVPMTCVWRLGMVVRRSGRVRAWGSLALMMIVLGCGRGPAVSREVVEGEGDTPAPVAHPGEPPSPAPPIAWLAPTAEPPFPDLAGKSGGDDTEDFEGGDQPTEPHEGTTTTATVTAWCSNGQSVFSFHRSGGDLTRYLPFEFRACPHRACTLTMRSGWLRGQSASVVVFDFPGDVFLLQRRGYVVGRPDRATVTC